MSFRIIFLLLLTFCALEPSFSKVQDGNGSFDRLIDEKKRVSSIDDLKSWVDKVNSFFLDSGKSRELVEFYGELAITEKNSMYSSYLYFIISDIYWQNDNKEVSVYYMTKIDENSYNITYKEKAIGYLTALRVIGYDCNYKFQERMYKLLLTRYSDIIDVFYTMYDLASLYKKRLDMQSAIKVMENIIVLTARYKNIEESDKLTEIKQEVNFYYQKKTWIYKDIKELIKNIKKSINQKNIGLMRSYISKNGFDVIFFKKTSQDKWNFNELDIETHITGNIVFSDKFEDISNENEIYLRTENWDFPQMTTWYFYFKRVDYPYDERIDGGWEWKGIYFGELF